MRASRKATHFSMPEAVKNIARRKSKSFAHLPQSCTSILIDMRLSPAHTAPTSQSSKQELVEPIVIILAT